MEHFGDDVSPHGIVKVVLVQC